MEVNLEQLEDMYGADLVNRIKNAMERAIKNNIHFKIEKVSESKCFVEVALVTDSYAYIYEVMLSDKTIVSENRISWRACENIFKLMNSFN